MQEKIIENVLKRKDTLVIMPTGGGKSVCFQVPAMIFNGLTVVVSPLISLMKDQGRQLKGIGIPVVILNSSLSEREYRSSIEKIRSGEAKMLYAAPETLLKNNILALLSEVQVDCIAIDEAHCISSWGHDFRPEYRMIADVRERFLEAVCMALTATATPRVRDDIQGTLNFSDSDIFIDSFDRKNLFIRVEPRDQPVARLTRFINDNDGGPGIIYCSTRRQVDNLSASLEKAGFKARPYHAGLDVETRRNHQEMFDRDDVMIIVATVAFGMGIDKSNVRFVAHYSLPKNLESYYQEIGRAGRDSLRSECLLLYSMSDIFTIRSFFKDMDEVRERAASIHLSTILGFVETTECRRKPLLKYFGEEYGQENCGMCDNCTDGPKELEDITIEAQKFLACVKRTGEMFGAVYIIDVLRGSKAKKVLKQGHDKLSTYGIGVDIAKKVWQNLARQFVQKGLLDQDMEFGGLSLTSAGWDVLRGKPFQGIIDKSLDNDAPAKSRTSSTNESNRDYNTELFNLLKIKRKELADKQDLPPYAVFSDRSLKDMSAFFPQSTAGFSNIHGVGQVKLQKYGEIFMDIIREFCALNSITESSDLKGADEPVKSSSVLTPRYVEVAEKFNSGRSVNNLMEEYSVKQTTIIGHLYKYWCHGGLLSSDKPMEYNNQVKGDANGLVKEAPVNIEKANRASAEFRSKGVMVLKPVFEALDGEIDYEELSFLRIRYIVENGLVYDSALPE